VQPGEGESRLGRHARRGDHRHPPLASSPHGSLEQRGLPDPRFAAHDERAAAPPDPIDQAVKASQLVVSAEKRSDSRVGGGASQIDLASFAATLQAVVAADQGDERHAPANTPSRTSTPSSPVAATFAWQVAPGGHGRRRSWVRTGARWVDAGISSVP
jgi:hypothetical protein